jgi:hypothetical protein
LRIPLCLAAIERLSSTSRSGSPRERREKNRLERLALSVPDPESYRPRLVRAHSFDSRLHVHRAGARQHPFALALHRIGARALTHRTATQETTTMLSPKSYRTIEEFEREELRAHDKAGFSLDDLMQETMLHASDLLFDDQVDELDPEEDE